MTAEHPPLASDAVTVGSDDELKRALKARRQQIVLKAGVTFEDDYTLDIDGLLVVSERPQAAVIAGEWVTAGDRMMVHGPLVKGGRIVVGGFDNVLRRIEFTGWEGRAIAVVNGAHGYPKGGRLEIGWCTAHHPAPGGCPPGTKPQPSRVVIRGKSSGPGTVHLGGLIQHVHFHHLPAKLGPGYYGQTDTIELVPDGPSHPDVKTGWTYRFILIEDHAGGDAVFDCKAGGETIEDVTILRCPKGRLDFRMGSGSKARRLWLGAGVGMSVSGSGHEIEDVFLEDGNLNLIAGSVAPDVWKRPGGNRPLYQQPMRNALRRVTGKGRIVLGQKYSGSTLPVTGTVIEGCDVLVSKVCEADTKVVPSAAKAVPVRKLTTAECGITAGWPDAGEPEPADKSWRIEWRQPDGSSYAPPWYWVHAYQDLPDFTHDPKGAAAYSEAEALAGIPEVGRYVMDAKRLAATKVPA